MVQTTDGSQKSYESFWFLFLSGIYALITLVLFLRFEITNNTTKSDDFNFYILGWAFFYPWDWGWLPGHNGLVPFF